MAPAQGLESVFIRVATVQIDYHPALFAHFRSPLEDPGGTATLLPENADIPVEMRVHFDKLRIRVREAYCRQLLARLTSILRACRTWEVKIVVLPEYSVPWDILVPLAQEAGPMVVVAGTHRVEPMARRSGVYEQLGCPEGELPRPGQAVAPVLHQGRLLALVPKLHADEAVREEIEPGEAWQPVALPDGFPGPMGVLTCFDFIHCESPSYRRLVAERLADCRFLAVPSWTATPSIPELQAKAWEQARRYGRPVLYAGHASVGGTAFFVDEERHSDLLPYPEKPGCLCPGEEGLLVADIDMGYERPGPSTRYAKTRSVRPQAAASLVYRARPIEDGYAAYVIALWDHLDPEGGGLDPALEHIEKHRSLLRQVRDAASGTRRRRLDRLLDDTRFLESGETIALLACELPLHPSALPMEVLRAVHIKAAAEAVMRWLVKSSALGAAVVKLLDEAAHLRPLTLVEEARQKLEHERRLVRGTVLGEASPADYIGKDYLTASNGVSVSIRRHARDFEIQISPSRAADILGFSVDKDLPKSEHISEDAELDCVAIQLPAPYVQSAITFSEVLAVEGHEPAAAIVVTRVFLMDTSGVVVRRGRSIMFSNSKIFLLIRGRKWRLATFEPTFRIKHPRADVSQGEPETLEEKAETYEDKQLYPPLDAASREPIMDALEEWGIEIEGIDVVDDKAFGPRFDAVLARLERARDTVREIRQRRLADVGGHFVEPSLAHERISVEDGWRRRTERIIHPAIEALADLFHARPNERDLRAAIVLGEYGSGKSTLLAEWAFRLWEAPEGPRPLLVDLAGSSATTPLALLLEAARLEDTPANRSAIRLAIRSGRYFPVFDGFDEMATRVTAAELPQRLADLFDTAQRVGRVVLSSRDHYFPTEGELTTALDRALTASLGGPVIARRFTMCFFSDAQARSLLLKVTGDEATTDALWLRIQRTYDLEELCRRPILLAMVIAARDDLLVGASPRRGDLYEACLRRWLQQTDGPDPEIFTTEQKRLLAETIAVETWRSGEPGVALDTLRRLLHASFPPAFFDDIPRTAEVLETTGGMFLVRALTEAGDRYRFAHKSFQEYFLASAIVRAAESGVRELPDVLSIKPLTREVLGFIDELLDGERGAPGSTFVANVRRWLVGRCTPHGQTPATTAAAAANAARLLLQLARLRGDGAGWIPEKADLRDVSLAGEDLHGARLIRARLERANLCGADLHRAEMAGANLRGALLRGAKLDDVNLQDALAEDADFTMAEASRATLEGGRLQRAIFRQSMWVHCRWGGASLTGADALAWMAPGAEGLGADAGVEPMQAPWAQIELVADKDEREAWQSISTGDWRPDGARITAVTFGGNFFVWDIHTRRCLAFLPGGPLSRHSSAIRWASAADVVVALDPQGELHSWSERDWGDIKPIGGPFESVAVNPEGTLVAATKEDGHIWIMRISSGEEIAGLPPSGAPVLDLAFSPDGRTLAITYQNGLGVVWSFSEGGVWTFHMAPRGTPIQSLAWHPNDALLACSTGDFFLRSWQVSSRCAIGDILMSERGLENLRFSSTGAYLAGLALDRTIRVWELAERQEGARASMESSEQHPTLAWSPDDSRIASFGPTIDIWNRETGLRISRLDRSTRGVFDFLHWSKTSDHLLCRGRHLDRPLLVECSSGHIAWFPGPRDILLAGWGTGDELIAAVGGAGTLQSCRPDGGLVGPERVFEPAPVALPMLVGGVAPLWAGALTEGRRLYLWDVATGHPIASWSWRRWSDPLRMDLSSTGRLLAVGNRGGVDILRPEPDTSVEFTADNLKSPWAWNWCPVDESMTFVKDDGALRTWSPRGDAPPPRAALPDAWSIRWHPRRERLAIGHEDGRISFLDPETLAAETTLRGHAARVCMLSWSRHGTRLASVDEAGVLCIWDASRGCLLLTLTGAGATALARTPGGYCDFLGGVASDYRLAVAPRAGSRARLYVPLGGLQGALHQPEKVAAALRGDLSGDDAEAELARLGYLNGLI